MISRYTRERMRLLWSEANKYKTWLRVELAICEALQKQGIISAKDLKNIQEKTSCDIDEIVEEEKKSKHDVAAFVTVISRKLGEEGRFIHYGVTSSDVLDTSLALLLKECMESLIEDTENLLSVLKNLALQFKDTLMVGRSHGIHAEPTTFGLKCALWFGEMKRNRDRLQKAQDNISYGKISGSVGTYAHLSSKIEEYVCHKLGLKADPITTQIIQRDRHAEYFTTLAILASSIEKIAVEIRHLQRTEVGEAEESFSSGQKGSSSMPHKKNPILSENISGLARLVRAYAAASLEDIPLWHERDISHSSVERVIAPDATILVDFMLSRLTIILENLVINKNQMLENLNKTKGLIYSQKILLNLIQKGFMRDKAYELVQRNALKALQTGEDFEVVILQDPDIRKKLNEKEIHEAFDPRTYIKEVDQTFRRVFES